MPEVSQRSPLIGRMFVNPVFDYLLIGGALSLIVIPLVRWTTGGSAIFDFRMLPWFILCSNSAHFPASTVRLYTKDGARESLPYVTGLLPAVFIVIVGISLFLAGDIGRYFQILYLTWSPYHYAAQAFGLSMMYCHRSGFRLTSSQKRLFWWIAILPFAKALITSQKQFLPWILPAEIIWTDLILHRTADEIAFIIGVAAMVLPVLFYLRVKQTAEAPMPLISLLVIMTNGVWFVVFEFLDGFVLATIFHGIQYLTIVIIFHVREQTSRAGNTHGIAYHVAWFYGICVLLGFGLFNCWPLGYEMLGFNSAESTLLVVAAINIHHFIVDSKIWKLERDRGNRRIVVDDPASLNA